MTPEPRPTLADAGPRLRAMNDALEENARLRLTDAEREAIDAAAHAAAQLYSGPEGVALAATLRGLLQRLG